MSSDPANELRSRAWRILHDGLTHSDATWRWALHLCGFPSAEQIEREVRREPFSDRELSLGAQPW